MDRSWGSDDMLADRQQHLADEALERWHERHEFPEDWADECPICEEAEADSAKDRKQDSEEGEN